MTMMYSVLLLASIAYILFISYPSFLSRSQESFQEYDKDDLGILARKNAANILVLRDRIDTLVQANAQMETLRGDVDQLQAQMQGMAQQNAIMAQSMVGGENPVSITGM